MSKEKLSQLRIIATPDDGKVCFATDPSTGELKDFNVESILGYSLLGH